MTYQGDELRIMREALSIALDALIEQEKKLDPPRRRFSAPRCPKN